MKQLKNFLIKREQSQACLSFAKREKSRLLAKTLLTLVALLAVTTGAWAAQVELKLGAKIKNGDVLTFGSTRVHFTTPCSRFYAIFSAVNTSTNVAIGYDENAQLGYMMNDTYIAFKPLLDLSRGQDSYFSGEGESLGLNTGQTIPEYVMVTDGTGTYADPFILTPYATYICEGLPVDGKAICDAADPSAATGPKVTWTAATKTGSFTMPGGNVTLEPEYYPQAALTAAPKAINDVPATTDGAIVEAGTVANITGTTTAQGTVMYYAVQSATAPTAPDYDATGWTDKVPTATDFAEGNVYVWYYVKGAEPASVADRTDANTCSDSEITALGTTGYVTLLAAPKYNAEFAFDEGTPDAEKAKWGTNIPDGGVVKGTAVTVTYTGTKKVIGVKAEKKAAGPLAAAFKDGAKFKVGYQWNGGLTTYLEFTNSGGTYSLTSVSGANELNGFNSSTLTVKNGNVLALDVVCHPEGDSKIDEFSAQIEFDATSSTYKYSSKGGYFDGIISVSVNDADITSQLTPAN